MNKPIIGIIPLVDSEKDSYWMLPGYMKGIEMAGGIPVMLPLTSSEEDLLRLVNQMDGFLFTGGQDVSPYIYNHPVSEKCGECCKERDEMEMVLFRLAYIANKAILGICRGIQFINAAMGGTLYQDLPTEKPSHVVHNQLPPYDLSCHDLTIQKDSPLYRLLEKDIISVNSYHHQAIKNVAPKVQPMAYSEDGLVEAIYVPERKFVWAVQWHPELSYLVDEDSRKILIEFISNCS